MRCALFGPIVSLVMFGGMEVSVGVNLAGSLLSSPRVTYALWLDGRLPAWFAVVSPRFGTPAVSIIVFGAAVFVLAVGGSFVWLAGLSVLSRVFIYIGCIAALPELRRHNSTEPGVMRLPGGLLIPAVAVMFCLALLTQVKAADYLVTAAMLGVGTVLYWVARHAGWSKA